MINGFKSKIENIDILNKEKERTDAKLKNEIEKGKLQ